jgi:carbon starvation protein
MIAACVLTPGAYFAMNSPAAVIGKDVMSAAHAISNFGFTITPDDLKNLAKQIGETTILSRTGGAPTLAVGMASIFSRVIGGNAFMAFWYHFAILFEAVFILTTIDAGTRVGRFILQDLFGRFSPKLGKTEWYPANILASGLFVAAWGYFLYQGVIDPLGGINTLWPLFGIANQMLAVVALTVGTTILIKKGKTKYSWVTLVPLAWLTTVTMTAGWQKLFHEKASIGFLAAADKYQKAIDAGQVIAPAKTMEEMHRVVLNNQIDAVLTGLFMFLVALIIVDSIRVWYKVLVKQEQLPIKESPYIAHEPSTVGG